MLGRPILFAGHGETDGLRFEDEGGRSFVPDSGALGALLRRRGVETVVLNACYSLAIIQATPMGTRYTVGMDGPLDDAGAIEFARGFYDGIGAGQSVEDAYEEGLSCAGLKGVAVKAVLVKA